MLKRICINEVTVRVLVILRQQENQKLLSKGNHGKRI
jgi:hypothetical protein